MQLEFYNRIFDLEDDVDLFFLHEHVLYESYAKSKFNSNVKLDRFSRVWNKDIANVCNQRAKTGSIDFAKPLVRSYDTELFENVSEDFTMCWKSTDSSHDTLVIHLTSYAGHEGRLTSPLTNISEKITNLDTDLLIVNEDPFRMPESIYPSNLILGCSDTCNDITKMCAQIRTYIKKDYKHVVIYADSKHAGSTVSIAYELSDLNIRVLVTGGQTTYNWDTSPWVKGYLKWCNRPEQLKYQFFSITPVAVMHIVKCYKFKQMKLDERIIDPYRFLDDYNILVDYYYGKYDTDYSGFKNYIKRLELNNLSMHEVDYKISDSQTHNIRPYADRFILSEYIKNL